MKKENLGVGCLRLMRNGTAVQFSTAEDVLRLGSSDFLVFKFVRHFSWKSEHSTSHQRHARKKLHIQYNSPALR